MNSKNIKLSSLIENKEEIDFYFNKIYKELFELENEYPYFKKWLFNKVKKEFILGKREIFIRFDKENIVGIAILKKEEKKVCTLRVSKNYQKKGIGTSLLEDSISFLETNKPIISVNSLREKEFENIFKKFNFKKTTTLNNLYKNGEKEIFYN